MWTSLPDWATLPGARPGIAGPAPVVAPARAPMVFLFECPIEQDYAHPLWLERPEAVACVRCDVRCTVTPDGKEWFDPARSPLETVRSFVIRLTRMMDLMAPHFGPRNVPMRWVAHPAGWGGSASEKERAHFTNQIPLLNHPDDRLASGRRGPFASRGISANAKWSAEFFAALADTLKDRRLPDPVAFVLSSESGPGDDQAGHINDPDTGWVLEALADDRADDPAETVDGTHTFAEFMATARALDGGPIPRYNPRAPFANPPGRSPLNAESTDRYASAMALLWDHGRDRAFNRLVRERFAGRAGMPLGGFGHPPVCEYLAAATSAASPLRVWPGTWRHHMRGVFATDLQTPDFYGGWPSMFDNDAVFKDAGPGHPTRANWLAVLPEAADDLRTIRDPARRDQRLALHIAKLNATQHALAAPDAPLAPYVTHGSVPEDDVVEYLRHVRSVGGIAANVFMPASAPRATLDFWHRVIARVNA
jgi:hypothetical protein